ncbi:MAG TPA: hypothetical protein VIK11_01465 [Tepidiformaceae bacterium]
MPSVTNSQHFLFDHLASAGALSLLEASTSAGSSGCRRLGHRSRRAIGPVSTCRGFGSKSSERVPDMVIRASLPWSTDLRGFFPARSGARSVKPSSTG